ncbi:hypothetical protein [Roseibium polysiphoniae]|nr:hypothetical protein [Roseibium polysiphoniae]
MILETGRVDYLLSTAIGLNAMHLDLVSGLAQVPDSDRRGPFFVC